MGSRAHIRDSRNGNEGCYGCQQRHNAYRIRGQLNIVLYTV